MKARILFGVILIIAMMGMAYAQSANYYANDAKESPLLSQAQLKAWIDAGYKTESGKRVVILDTTPSLDHGNYIPGAVQPAILAEYAKAPEQGWGMTRTDGVMKGVANEVFDGPTMDKLIQAAGIDMNTVIVLTNDNFAGDTNPNLNQVTRAYWVFYYWGFSKENLKLLNGGNIGYAAEYGKMQEKASAPTIKSTFSVKDLPGNRIDLVRAPFGEIYEGAKNGTFERGEAVLIYTMGPGASTKYADGKYGTNGPAFNGTIRGVKILADKDGANLGIDKLLDLTPGYDVFAGDKNVLFADANGDGKSILPTDKNKRIIVHCGSGQSTTPYWFYLTFILGYTNVAVYDGSSGEWNSATVSGTNGSAPAEYLKPTPSKWAKWDGSKWVNAAGAEVGGIISSNKAFKYDTALVSGYVSFSNPAAAVSVNTAYTGDAKEINKADKAYQGK
jgi:3-mercaptopyruvate sulfurtransferase SseA